MFCQALRGRPFGGHCTHTIHNVESRRPPHWTMGVSVSVTAPILDRVCAKLCQIVPIFCDFFCPFWDLCGPKVFEYLVILPLLSNPKLLSLSVPEKLRNYCVQRAVTSIDTISRLNIAISQSQPTLPPLIPLFYQSLLSLVYHFTHPFSLRFLSCSLSPFIPRIVRHRQTADIPSPSAYRLLVFYFGKRFRGARIPAHIPLPFCIFALALAFALSTCNCACCCTRLHHSLHTSRLLVIVPARASALCLLSPFFLPNFNPIRPHHLGH